MKPSESKNASPGVKAVVAEVGCRVGADTGVQTGTNSIDFEFPEPFPDTHSRRRGRRWPWTSRRLGRARH